MFGTRNPDFIKPADEVVGYLDHEAGTENSPRGEVLCPSCLYERNLSPYSHGIERLTRAYVEDCNRWPARVRPLHCDRCNEDLED